MCQLVLADGHGALVPGDGGNGFGGAGLGGVDGFQNGIVQSQQLVDRNGLTRQSDHGDFGGLTDAAGAGQIDILGQFSHDAAHLGDIPVDILHAGLEANLVAEGHLHHGLSQAVFHGPSSLYLPSLAQGVELFPSGLQTVSGAVGGSKEINGMSSSLKLGGEHLSCLHRGDGEGDQSGGDILVQERSGHRILAADGGRPQFQLGVQSA